MDGKSKKIKSTREYVFEMLYEKGMPLSVVEIISELKNKYGIVRSKQQMRNALNGFDCKDIVRIERETYDLLSRIVNGKYYRHTLSRIEYEHGVVSADNDLYFILNAEKLEHRGKIVFKQSDQTIIKEEIKISPTTIYRRYIGGFKEWFHKVGLEAGDDIIIRIIDYDKGEFELIAQKNTLRDEELIKQNNQKVADILEEVLNRAYDKEGLVSVLLTRVFPEYAYRDSIPPDSLTVIAQQDRRFVVDMCTSGLLPKSDIKLISLRKHRRSKGIDDGDDGLDEYVNRILH